MPLTSKYSVRNILEEFEAVFPFLKKYGNMYFLQHFVCEFLLQGFILVYSITSQESFRHCEAIKKEIDKLSKEKDKKEVSEILVEM